MNLITTFNGAIANATLDQVLMELAKHGRTRVGQYSTAKWSCCVEMNVAAKGVSFEVRSSYDHDTPLSAAKECAERVAEAIKR